MCSNQCAFITLQYKRSNTKFSFKWVEFVFCHMCHFCFEYCWESSFKESSPFRNLLCLQSQLLHRWRLTIHIYPCSSFLILSPSFSSLQAKLRPFFEAPKTYPWNSQPSHAKPRRFCFDLGCQARHQRCTMASEIQAFRSFCCVKSC